MDTNTAILQDGNQWVLCARPHAVLQTVRPAEVPLLLQEVESACRNRYFAAGFLAYEAAPGLDPVFTTRPPRSSLPLAWFALYGRPIRVRRLPDPKGFFRVGSWRPDISRAAYRRAIGSIRRYIAAGDTYQVNYTFRLQAEFEGEPFNLFHALVHAQQSRYSAYLDTGRFAVCSASPELFLEIRGRRVRSCPMKGTAPRGLTAAADDAAAVALAGSAKNRAENVMIVDMVRNDLGRVAVPGTVKAVSLFDVERYPTVLQMTSTVEARSSAGIADILAATFPCASITGAPKVRTMEIIAETEHSPRGIYTGAIGWIAPGSASPARRAGLNVAIRTVVVDKREGTAEYGIGGGIVWDSVGGQEYQECLTKARILTASPAEFRLFETMLWTPADGYFLLDRHLKRLSDSARYFGFRMNESRLIRALMQVAGAAPNAPQVVRLLLDRSGRVETQTRPCMPGTRAPARVALARTHVCSCDVCLYHKTTRRDVYEAARAERSEADDVILFNERGEVTESTIANVVVTLGRTKYTPPVRCGLLAGTFRAHLLDLGLIRERVITRSDLRRATAVHLVNSVRKWVPVRLLGL